MSLELLYHVNEHVLPSALSLLPATMSSREARAQLLAICLQETECDARRQGGRGTRAGIGPATGLWQFERAGGVKEILSHATTGPIVKPICRLLLYSPTPAIVHAALEHNDTLAAVFARLLLWVDPRTLPTPIEHSKGWSIYLNNWRPGKPHPEKWKANFSQAWAVVKGDEIV